MIYDHSWVHKEINPIAPLAGFFDQTRVSQGGITEGYGLTWLLTRDLKFVTQWDRHGMIFAPPTSKLTNSLSRIYLPLNGALMRFRQHSPSLLPFSSKVSSDIFQWISMIVQTAVPSRWRTFVQTVLPSRWGMIVWMVPSHWGTISQTVMWRRSALRERAPVYRLHSSISRFRPTESSCKTPSP